MKLYRVLLVVLCLLTVSANAEIPYPYGFVFMGDTGTGEAGQFAVSNGIEKFCKTNPCDFGLLLGDNIYPLGSWSKKDKQFLDKFEQPYRNLDFKWYPVLGNHDYYGIEKTQLEYKSERWDMPGRYYVTLLGDAEILAIDTNKIASDTKQRSWLIGRLAASKARWKIVYGHYPVYSGGVHGNNLLMERYFLPIAKETGVDFYLSGHDHDQQYIQKDGINFVVAGAGAKVRKTKMTADTIFAASELGFSHLLFDGDRAVLSMVDKRGKVMYSKAFWKHQACTLHLPPRRPEVSGPVSK